MPALDSCEPQVIRAFEKDGWAIHRKPLILDSHYRTFFADFSLQKRTNGTTQQIIVLEVKCFPNPRQEMVDLYTALGQYQFYHYLLAPNGLDVPIYLVIPDPVYARLTLNPDIEDFLISLRIRLVVVDLDSEEITRWV